jgi:hypothetical protein
VPPKRRLAFNGLNAGINLGSYWYWTWPWKMYFKHINLISACVVQEMLACLMTHRNWPSSFEPVWLRNWELMQTCWDYLPGRTRITTAFRQARNCIAVSPTTALWDLMFYRKYSKLTQWCHFQIFGLNCAWIRSNVCPQKCPVKMQNQPEFREFVLAKHR